MTADNTDSGGASFAPLAVQPLEARVRALAQLSIVDLKSAWSEVWGRPPPKGARRRFLLLGIAWKWQAEVHGGFAKATERRLSALETAGLRNGKTSDGDGGAVCPPSLMPGSRLIRVYKGERHEVHVTEKGYLWRGRSWTSLSSIAREITGARRNGPAFFGLREGSAR